MKPPLSVIPILSAIPKSTSSPPPSGRGPTAPGLAARTASSSVARSAVLSSLTGTGASSGAEGRDYTLLRYPDVDPHPDKEIARILCRHVGNTDAEILLFEVKI